LFASYATTICTTQKSAYADKAPGKSVTVLYAGREATLPVLVGQFQQASICAGLPVTIVTGSDANTLPASVTDESDDLPGADVTVVYSDIESVDHLGDDFKTGTRPPGACLNQEYDPWEVATYNSVTAAAAAVSSAADARAGSAPSPLTAAVVLSKALNLVGSAPYPAPNGSFGFSIQGELRDPVIPVYTEANGACS
jgi:hypothetical protein